ncbi:hypothetical protein [Pontibacter sp. H249]|uniref:hypothetical protein n=1 Tax=Pontibacter sp. H249 TaxID=3133420 RepID=UPI0030C231FA
METSKRKITSPFLYLMFWNSFLTTIIILSWSGKIRFGLGLADALIDALIVAVMIVVDLAYFLSTRTSSIMSGKGKQVIWFSIAFAVWVALKMTILRGGESSWDGQIFFN